MKIKTAVLIFVLFLLIGSMLPPAFRKNAGEGTLTVSEIESIAGTGESIYCIDDNLEALTLRLKAIDGAEDRVIVSSLDLRDDNSGRDIMAALYSASARGVEVEILLDGLTSAPHLYLSKTFRTLIAGENVTARYYNPINLLKPWKLNYRLHDKYMICDDDLYILGGRNLHDLFLGDYVDTFNVDRDILVYNGGSIDSLLGYFESVWESDEVRDINYHIGRRSRLRQETEFSDRWTELCRRYPEITEYGDWEDMTYKVNSVTLLTNPTNAGNKEPVLWNELLGLTASGGDVTVETPYIILNSGMYKSVAGVTECVDSFRFVTNSVETGVNVFGCGDYLFQRESILGTGASVTEWLGYQSLHGKALVIDGNISVVGSFNFDVRSAYLDTELMLVIDSPELNRQIRGQLDDMESQGRTAYPDGTVFTGTEAADCGRSAAYRLLQRIVGLIEKPFRYLL